PLFTVNDASLVITHDHIQRIDQVRKLEDDHEDYLDWDQEVSLICMTPEDLVEDLPPPPMKKRGLFERMKTTPAFTNRWTHFEIHLSMILGICASLIPFPDHNQLGKQTMGIHATNYQLRMDITSNLLYYPQKPLVTTKVMEYLKFREMPAGQNAMVAILCYGGYNQEDSIIMNQSGLKHGSYHKLGEDSAIIPGIAVSGGSILIGKVTSLPPDIIMLGQRSDTQINRDISTMLKYAEIGYIDQVLIGSNQENRKFAKVKIRSTRIPEIGDKFASRHGQKGTIGMTYRQEDMSFTREGIVPDIIINPHAIPNRMTIGHLIESLMGKLSVLTGNEGDATPFTDVTVEDLSKNLRVQGYHSRGLEVIYNGHTGRKLVTQIFVGPTYYQRLKHMLRARGPVNPLTRQPAEGRNREGGLRFGEMERDCMISHGTALFLKLDKDLANKIQDLLNEYFRNSNNKPSFIGDIEISGFCFGNIPPSIEIVNIILEFYLPDNEVVDIEFRITNDTSVNSSYLTDATSIQSDELTDKSEIPMEQDTDAQIHVNIDYKGDMRMTITTELHMNYPSMMFMSLPIRLTVTGFEFSGSSYEIGDNEKQVLKNVEKLERFIVDQLRKLIDVFPSYYSIEL
ncbi:44203_t:CDS:10, partial [Gigaspora margarita]